MELASVFQLVLSDVGNESKNSWYNSVFTLNQVYLMLFKENVTDSSHQNTENHLPSAEICVDATSQRHPTPVFDDN
ncbi:hypothetical protein OUZ56_033265 [Daphnia magna]|uniref:Uncharacterized protein n=1 Tax=Daphnia magna TaxID=35525 RepID=A0ABQ9ZXV1_9CRUS|nr:hypothetical protein OUZ56_033265 [Daphnia magna]